MSRTRRLRVRLAKSPIGARAEHKATARALGLRRLGQEVLVSDSPSVRGMIESISYMVEIVDTDEDGE